MEIFSPRKLFEEVIGKNKITEMVATRQCEVPNNIGFSTPFYGTKYTDKVKEDIDWYKKSDKTSPLEIEVVNVPRCANLMLDNIEESNSFFAKTKINIDGEIIDTYRPLIRPEKFSCFENTDKELFFPLNDILGFDLREINVNTKQGRILRSEILIKNPIGYRPKITAKKGFEEMYSDIPKECHATVHISQLPPKYSENIIINGGTFILRQTIKLSKYNTNHKLLRFFNSVLLGEYLVERGLNIREFSVDFSTKEWEVRIFYGYKKKDIVLLRYEKKELEDLIKEIEKKLNIKKLEGEIKLEREEIRKRMLKVSKEKLEKKSKDKINKVGKTTKGKKKSN